MEGHGQGLIRMRMEGIFDWIDPIRFEYQENVVVKRPSAGSVFVLGETEGSQPQSLLERPRPAPGVWYGGERACGKAWHCRASFRVSITLWFQGLSMSSCALQSP